ncbi:MAG: alpha/beta hydrolase [Planctomycetota bacterium]
MTTPAVLEGQEPGYFAASVAPDRIDVPVFVAHARRENPDATQLDQRFTTDLSRSLHLGRVPVRIGEAMPAEDVLDLSLQEKRKQPVLLDASFDEYVNYGILGHGTHGDDDSDDRFDQQDDLIRLLTHEKPGTRFGDDAFARAINDELARRGSTTITIYVHGFNTRFIDNLCRSGELSHYLGQDGTMISFQWPSKARVASYFVDKATSRNVLRQLRALLVFLADKTDATQIDIIGHSAGTLVVMETLRHLSLINAYVPDDELQAKLKIGQVVLAAPDIGREEAITAAMDGAARVTQGMTIYFSQLDNALNLSRFLYGEERLGFASRLVPLPIEIDGLVEPQMTVDADEVPDTLDAVLASHNIHAIDATTAQKGFSLSFFGHDYFAHNPYVSSDIILFLKHGNTPADRLLELRHAAREDSPDGQDASWYYSFPDDLKGYRQDVLRLAPSND